VHAGIPHSGTHIVPSLFSSYVHVQPMLSFYFPVRPFPFRAAVVPWTMIVERVTETASKMRLRLHDVTRLQTWPASWMIPAGKASRWFRGLVLGSSSGLLCTYD